MQKRILIVRTDRVGDVVMITPVIREIRRTFQDAFIATLTNPNSSDILINNPHIDIAITDDLKKDTFWKIVGKLRKYKFTHGLLVMPTERAAWQMFFSGIKSRIGVGRKLYEVITLMKSVSRNKYIPLKHEADYCMDMARKIGVKSGNILPEIFLNEEELILGKNFLKSVGISEGDFKIIIHTGSGKSSSNWTEEKYFELIIKILKEKPTAKIILTAKEMTSDFKTKIESLQNERVVFMDSKIKRLRDLICITANADLLIAASTGPLHIASALKIKTIGIFCHRSMSCVKHWGALGENAVNIEVSKENCDKLCSPDKEICNFENGISVEEVLEKV